MWVLGQWAFKLWIPNDKVSLWMILDMCKWNASPFSMYQLLATSCNEVMPKEDIKTERMKGEKSISSYDYVKLRS